MASDSLFCEALTRHGIPDPPKRVQEGVFVRWGDHRGSTKYWATQAGDCHILGDFSTGLKECVFPGRGKRSSRRTLKKAKAVAPKDGYSAAAKEAQKIWTLAGAIGDATEHGYLINKEIDELPESGYPRIDHDGNLVIPLTDQIGTIVSVQFIGGDGRKRFLGGGRTKGCYCKILGSAPKTSLVTFLAEGYATGWTIYRCLRDTELDGQVVVCFYADNLKPVAELIRSQNPKMEIIFCADDDRYGQTNIGRKKAVEAAEAIKGITILPEFREASLTSKRLASGKPTDFNDLYLLEGLDEIRRQLLNVSTLLNLAEDNYEHR
jgi:putative DNA primase/helicase